MFSEILNINSYSYIDWIKIRSHNYETATVTPFHSHLSIPYHYWYINNDDSVVSLYHLLCSSLDPLQKFFYNWISSMQQRHARQDVTHVVNVYRQHKKPKAWLSPHSIKTPAGTRLVLSPNTSNRTRLL